MGVGRFQRAQRAQRERLDGDLSPGDSPTYVCGWYVCGWYVCGWYVWMVWDGIGWNWCVVDNNLRTMRTMRTTCGFCGFCVRRQKGLCFTYFQVPIVVFQTKFIYCLQLSLFPGPMPCSLSVSLSRLSPPLPLSPTPSPSLPLPLSLFYLSFTIQLPLASPSFP